MREQDILKQIKASAEEMEIPESLMPENIEKMLKEKLEENSVKRVVAKQIKYRFQPLH